MNLDYKAEELYEVMKKCSVDEVKSAILNYISENDLYINFADFAADILKEKMNEDQSTISQGIISSSSMYCMDGSPEPTLGNWFIIARHLSFLANHEEISMIDVHTKAKEVLAIVDKNNIDNHTHEYNILLHLISDK